MTIFCPTSYGKFMLTFLWHCSVNIFNFFFNIRHLVYDTGIDSSLLSTFCPGFSGFEVPTPTSKHTEASSPCFLLLLEKENAAHNAASLIESCMIQLTLKGLMGKWALCFTSTLYILVGETMKQYTLRYCSFYRIFY